MVLSLLLLIFFLPLISFSAGLVPCGRVNDPQATEAEKMPCQLCHFFILFQRIFNFVVFDIVPVLAILMVIIAGIYFLTAGGQPANIEKGKNILRDTAIVLLIIYGGWLLINLFFLVIGVADWTGLRTGWFKIKCPVP